MSMCQMSKVKFVPVGLSPTADQNYDLRARLEASELSGVAMVGRLQYTSTSSVTDMGSVWRREKQHEYW